MELRHFFGERQNLKVPLDQPYVLGDAFIQLMHRSGLYGAKIGDILPEEVFMTCQDLLALAAYVEEHRAWIEEHAAANEEWFANEVTGQPRKIRLCQKSNPRKQMTIQVETEHRFAWYGFPVSVPAEKRQLGYLSPDLREFPKTEWEKAAETRPNEHIS